MLDFFFSLPMLSYLFSAGSGADTSSKHPTTIRWGDLCFLEESLQEHIFPQLLFQCLFCINTKIVMGENTPRKAGMRTTMCDQL